MAVSRSEKKAAQEANALKKTLDNQQISNIVAQYLRDVEGATAKEANARATAATGVRPGALDTAESARREQIALKKAEPVLAERQALAQIINPRATQDVWGMMRDPNAVRQQAVFDPLNADTRARIQQGEKDRAKEWNPERGLKNTQSRVDDINKSLGVGSGAEHGGSGGSYGERTASAESRALQGVYDAYRKAASKQQSGLSSVWTSILYNIISKFGNNDEISGNYSAQKALFEERDRLRALTEEARKRNVYDFIQANGLSEDMETAYKAKTTGVSYSGSFGYKPNPNMIPETSAWTDTKNKLLSQGYSQSQIDEMVDAYAHIRGKERTREVSENAATWVQEHGPLGSAVGMLAGLANYFVNPLTGGVAAREERGNPYAYSRLPNAALTGASGAVKEQIGFAGLALGAALGMKHPETAKTAAEWIYEGGVSAAGSALTIMLGGALGQALASGMETAEGTQAAAKIGAVAGELFMSGGAYADEYEAALQKGLDNDTAVELAMCAGFFEALFEHLSLENIRILSQSTKTGVKAFAINAARSVFTEGSEEVFTEVADKLADALLGGALSDYAKFRDEYMRENPNADEKEAGSAYAKQVGRGLIEVMAVGGISGLFGTATGNAMRAVRTTGETIGLGATVQKAAQAQGTSPQDALRHLAQNAAGIESTAEIDALTNRSGRYDVGNAYKSVQREVSLQNESDAYDVLLEKGYSARTARAVAGTIARMAAGERTDESQKKELQEAVEKGGAESLTNLLYDLYNDDRFDENTRERLLDLAVESEYYGARHPLRGSMTQTALRKRISAIISDESLDEKSRDALRDVVDKHKPDTVAGIILDIMADEYSGMKERADALNAFSDAVLDIISATGSSEKGGKRKAKMLELLSKIAPDAKKPEIRSRLETMSKRQKAKKALLEHWTDKLVDGTYDAALDGEDVKVQEISGVEDGDIMITVDRESGASAKLNSLDFGESYSGRLAKEIYEKLRSMVVSPENGATAMTTDAANLALALWHSSTAPDSGASAFFDGFNEYYQMGAAFGSAKRKAAFRGISSANLTDRVDVLTDDQKTAAFEAGLTQYKPRAGVTRIGDTELTQEQSDEIAVMNAVFEDIGVRAVIVDTLSSVEGKAYADLYGHHEDGVILLSLEAMTTSGRTENILSVAAFHELYHYLDTVPGGTEWKRQKLTPSVIRFLKESKGIDYDAIYEQRRTGYGYDVSDAVIEEEIAAQFFGTAVADRAFMEAADTEDAKWYERMYAHLKRFVEKIHNRIKALAQRDLVSEAVLITPADMLDRFVKDYDEALSLLRERASKEAVVETRATEEEAATAVETEAETEEGKAPTTEEERQYYEEAEPVANVVLSLDKTSAAPGNESLATFNASEYVQERDSAAKQFAKEIGVTLEQRTNGSASRALDAASSDEILEDEASFDVMTLKEYEALAKATEDLHQTILKAKEFNFRLNRRKDSDPLLTVSEIYSVMKPYILSQNNQREKKGKAESLRTIMWLAVTGKISAAQAIMRVREFVQHEFETAADETTDQSEGMFNAPDILTSGADQEEWYGLTREEAATERAMRLYGDLLNAMPIKLTGAQREAIESVVPLRQIRAQTRRELRKKTTEEIEKIAGQEREEYAEAHPEMTTDALDLREARRRRELEYDALKRIAAEKLKATRDAAKERESKKSLIRHIRKSAHALYKKTTREKKTDPVYEPIKQYVVPLLKLLIGPGVWAKHDIEYAKERLDLVKTNVDVEEINPFTEDNMHFEQSAMEALKELFRTLALSDDTTVDVRKMNSENLKVIFDAIQNIATAVEKANDVIVKGRLQNREDLARRAMQRFDSAAAKMNAREIDRVQRRAYGFFSNELLTPTWFFRERLGGPFEDMYVDFERAQDKTVTAMRNAHDRFNELKKEYHYADWKDEAVTFTFKGADDTEWRMRLPIGAMLSIYATATRERTSAQGSHHLVNIQDGDRYLESGGVILTDELLKEQRKENKKLNPGEPQFVDDKVPRKLSNAEIDSVIDTLTDEQKQFADQVVSYLSTECARLGNETTMQMYGIAMFTETYYFPFTTPDVYSKSSKNNIDLSVHHLRDWGRTQPLKPRASTPVLIGDFMETANHHVNEMATYANYLIPIETMFSVFNFSDYVFETEDLDPKRKRKDEYGETYYLPKRVLTGKTMKASIDTAFGGSANRYIEDFIKLMNHGVQRDKSSGVSRWLLGRMKASAVVGNLSVALQQPISITRAMAMIDKKYFAGAIRPADTRDMLENSPIAFLKQIGGFETNIGKQLEEWMNADEKTIHDVANDVLSFGAEVGDLITWTAIWNACRREQRAANPGIENDREAYNEATNERFRTVINYTQVYYSSLQRNMPMRSGSLMEDVINAFAAEGILTYNMVLLSGKNKHTDESRVVSKGKAIGAFVANAVLTEAVRAVVSAWRDKDEDETYLEKMLEHFANGLFGSKSVLFLDGAWDPLTLIPLANSIIDTLSGYAPTRSDLQVVERLQETIANMMRTMRNSDGKPSVEAVLNLAGAISAIFGIPIQSATRDAYSLWRMIYRATHETKIPFSKTNSVNAVLEGIGFDKTTAEQAYLAVLDGDDEQISRLTRWTNDAVEAYVEEGMSADDARTQAEYDAVRKFHNNVTEGLYTFDKRVKDAAQAKIDGEYDLFEEILQSIRADGFDENDVMRAVKKAQKDLAPDEPVLNTDAKATGIYETADLEDAYLRGDREGVKRVGDYLVSHGKTRDSVDNAVKGYIKKDLINGILDEDTAADQIEAYFGIPSYQADGIVFGWRKTEASDMFKEGVLTDAETTSFLQEHAGMTRDEAVITLEGWHKNLTKDAFENGDMRDADVIAELVQNAGMTDEEARSTVRDWHISDVKWLYDMGGLTNEQAQRRLTTEAGLSEDDALIKTEFWSYKLQYPRGELTEPTFKKFLSDVKPSGITVEQYEKYLGDRGDYTRKDDILPVIDAQDLSPAQKDALYFAKGYAASNLWQAPWH